MKTLEELYQEIAASEELKNEYAEAQKNAKVSEFLKAHGCEATDRELSDFLSKKESGELSDEELDNAAGGGCSEKVTCPICGQPVVKYYACMGMHQACADKVQRGG